MAPQQQQHRTPLRFVALSLLLLSSATGPVLGAKHAHSGSHSHNTNNHFPRHPHLLGRTAISVGNGSLGGLVRFMAPRSPAPAPAAIAAPGHGPVTDFGKILNLSSEATSFSHGLMGVDQATNWLFANVLLISFMGLLAITLGYRAWTLLNKHFRKLFTMGGTEEQRYWMYNHSHFWPRIKRDLILAPLGRQRHNKEIQLSGAVSIGTLPGRYHTILLLVYVASNIAYMMVLDWSNETTPAVIADLRGRSGVLAALNLIPTILFALRNNPLIPILSVPYDTFNLLHRWCARIVVLEAIVHTICWAVNARGSGGMPQLGVALKTSVSYLWGMIATCVFTFIVLTACGPIRHAFYETFLNAHRILVALGIAGVYIHLDRANLPQLPYIQFCIALWAAEWVWRSCRIFYHNVSRQKGITKVTIEALPAEACRVTFDLSRPWRWRPGCHVHAYLPAYALWSSHPFSIAWAEDCHREPLLPMEVEMEKLNPLHSRDSDRLGLRTRESYRKSIAIESTASESLHSPSTATKPGPDFMPLHPSAAVTSISLVMRARTGMTRKLYERAKAAPRATLTTWGAIEGPYGGHEDMTSYGTVVLFAGGVGITHCVSYVHHLLLYYAAGTASVQKILLIWSVPNTEALEWVRVYMDRILKMEYRRTVLRIQLFITKPRHRGEVVSSTGSVQMFPGRCNPQTIVEKEMTERIGAMGVTVCGPGAFADSVRSAVRGVVGRGNVDFVEEGFTY